MYQIFKKMQIAIPFFLITSISTVRADDFSMTDGCPQFCEPACFCSQACGQFFLDAQILYIRAFEGGLSSPCEGTQVINSTENGILISRLTGKAHDPDFKWHLGFRMGVGYEFADYPSDIGVYWMHYNPHADDDHNDYWNIDFNMVDVRYGWASHWSIDCSRNSILTLFSGLRCARINQKILSHFVSSEDGALTLSTERSREGFLGIGPLLGIERDWRIGCGFSLYGNIAVAILYGKYHVRSNNSSAFATGFNVNHLVKHVQASQFVVDAGFGMRWKTCFCKNRFLILQLELEHHRYFNHNQFCGYGDLSLDGMSLSAGILY